MPARTTPHGTWACEVCGLTRPASAHVNRYRFCSNSCAQKGKRPSRLAVEQKEVRKGIAARAKAVIDQGGTFKDAAKAEGIATPKMSKICKEFGVSKARRAPTRCEQCGKQFNSSPSQKRKFCSYKCHLASGGAYRAGEAAVMAMKKYGAKKDANHNDIFKAIRKIAPAKDLSGAGFGVPDGLAWVNGGWHLFDVKNPETRYGKRGLNPIQKKWSINWSGGPVYLIYTEDEAIAFAHGDFNGLKKFPNDKMTAAELAEIGGGK